MTLHADHEGQRVTKAFSIFLLLLGQKFRDMIRLNKNL